MRRLAALPLLLLAPVVLATTMLALTPEELAREADVVAVVRVGSVETVRAKGRLTTLARLLVETPLKGTTKDAELLARSPGGTAGDQVQVVRGAPELTEGERYLAFLEEAGGGTWRFVGLEQGALLVTGDGADAMVHHRSTAHLVARGPDGRLVDAPHTAEVEPFGPLLTRVRLAVEATR